MSYAQFFQKHHWFFLSLSMLNFSVILASKNAYPITHPQHIWMDKNVLLGQYGSFEENLLRNVTYMGVFGLDFVIELLPDEAAQIYIILKHWWYIRGLFFIHAFPFE